MFAVGFLSSLGILASKTSVLQPWKQTRISAPQVKTVCPPGHYYEMATDSFFCAEGNRTQLSLQCHICPKNTYSSRASSDSCFSCPYGSFSPPGSDHCVECKDDTSNSDCAAFAASRSAATRRTYMAIFIPLSILGLASLMVYFSWRCRKQYRRRRRLGDHDWLLRFSDIAVQDALIPPTSEKSHFPTDSTFSPRFGVDGLIKRHNTIHRTSEVIQDRRGSQRASLECYQHKRTSVSDPDLLIAREVRGDASSLASDKDIAAKCSSLSPGMAVLSEISKEAPKYISGSQ